MLLKDLGDAEWETLISAYICEEQLCVLSPVELLRLYSMYCNLFHSATWTSVSISKFARWATESPLDRIIKER